MNKGPRKLADILSPEELNNLKNLTPDQYDMAVGHIIDRSYNSAELDSLMRELGPAPSEALTTAGPEGTRAVINPDQNPNPNPKKGNPRNPILNVGEPVSASKAARVEADNAAAASSKNMTLEDVKNKIEEVRAQGGVPESERLTLDEALNRIEQNSEKEAADRARQSINSYTSGETIIDDSSNLSGSANRIENPRGPRSPGVLTTAGPEGTRAVINPDQNPNPNPKKGNPRNPILNVGEPVSASTDVSGNVITSGTGTPQPPGNSAPPTAVINNPSPPSTPSGGGPPSPGRGTSSGAPGKGLIDNIHNMSRRVAGGIKEAGNLKMAGVAALVGLGAYGATRRRTQQDNIDERLRRQRGY